jgi:hypothetical protein
VEGLDGAGAGDTQHGVGAAGPVAGGVDFVEGDVAEGDRGVHGFPCDGEQFQAKLTEPRPMIGEVSKASRSWSPFSGRRDAVVPSL